MQSEFKGLRSRTAHQSQFEAEGLGTHRTAASGVSLGVQWLKSRIPDAQGQKGESTNQLKKRRICLFFLLFVLFRPPLDWMVPAPG